MLRKSIIAFLTTIAAASPLIAEDYAVLISVSSLRNKTYDLPAASVNLEVMKGAFDAIGIRKVTILKDSDVNPGSVPQIFDTLADQLVAGQDRLFIYYTGHGIGVDEAGANVRAYFTYETRRSREGAFERSSLFTDLDLKNWLSPLRGVEVVFFRECCFNGGGYSESLQSFAPAPARAKGVRSDAVGTVEISACSFDQSAYAHTREDGVTLGLFTHALSERLTRGDSRLNADTLASHIESVLSQQKGQNPVRGGIRNDFSEFMIYDRSLMTLEVRVKDAASGQSLAAQVQMDGEVKGKTPLLLENILRDQGRVFPRVSLEGYASQSPTISLDDRDMHQVVEIKLKRLYAQVEGRIRESQDRSLEGVKARGRLLGAQEPIDEFFQAEVDVTAGYFTLTLPPDRGYEVMIFRGGETLARQKIENGEALEAFQSGKSPYNLEMEITLPSIGPSREEQAFETYFDQATQCLRDQKYQEALRNISKAEIAAQSINRDESRASAVERLDSLRTNAKASQTRYDAQRVMEQARTAFEAENYESAYRLCQQVLSLDKQNLDAKILLVDIEPHRAAKSHSNESTNDTRPALKIGQDGSEMVLIPAGTFRMGNPLGEADERVVRNVRVSSFYIDRVEVSWERYLSFCDATSRAKPTGWNLVRNRQLPVFNVSWEDASAYAAWAGKRLPTEAEWEYVACGGESGRAYPWGNDAQSDLAGNPDKTRSKTGALAFLKPVGSLPLNASPFGVLDLAGSVGEWCSDYYSPSYVKDQTDNPQGPGTGTLRVFRGGSWRHSLEQCRNGYRNAADPGESYDRIGFRCVSDAL